MSVHTILAGLLALIVVASGVAKLRRDPRVVKVIHEDVGLPLRWLPWLAGCEFAGAAGLVAGLVAPPLGMAASAGLIVYFLGAVVAHLRVGDWKGVGPAAFLLTVAIGCLVTRVLNV